MPPTCVKPLRHNPSILDEVLGLLSIVICIVASPLLRPWYRSWGSSRDEVAAPLAGDDQVNKPSLSSTRAITINAAVDDVWPWLVQMGQGRGGLYSYERLENLSGCDMHNADAILPEFQDIQIGSIVRLSQGEDAPHFVVSAAEAGRSLVLSGDAPPTTWAFVLQPGAHNTTRLIIRWRQSFDRTLANIIIWRVLTDPITFVMEREMLRGIKRRAESQDA